MNHWNEDCLWPAASAPSPLHHRSCKLLLLRPSLHLLVFSRDFFHVIWGGKEFFGPQCRFHWTKARFIHVTPAELSLLNMFEYVHTGYCEGLSHTHTADPPPDTHTHSRPLHSPPAPGRFSTIIKNISWKLVSAVLTENNFFDLLLIVFMTYF